MHRDNSKEWHWLKGGLLTSLLSVATYFIFATIAERNYPFGVTAGFGYIAAALGGLFEGLKENPVIRRYADKPDAFIEFFLLIGLIICRAHVRKLFNRLDRWITQRLWSHRHKRWRCCGWKTLPATRLYGELALVNLVRLIPSLGHRY